MRKNCNPHTLLVGLSKGAANLGNSLAVSQNVQIELPYDPAIPGELKTYAHAKPGT